MTAEGGSIAQTSGLAMLMRGGASVLDRDRVTADGGGGRGSIAKVPSQLRCAKARWLEFGSAVVAYPKPQHSDPIHVVRNVAHLRGHRPTRPALGYRRFTISWSVIASAHSKSVTGMHRPEPPVPSSKKSARGTSRPTRLKAYAVIDLL
jgi:hypothetical protein